ncbi:MAG: hypothetical protein KDK34_16095, partial [Leptospiraceae bacterium]|nr:hypothetical protein [Leptospiraceae bacterium]
MMSLIMYEFLDGVWKILNTGSANLFLLRHPIYTLYVFITFFLILQVWWGLLRNRSHYASRLSHFLYATLNLSFVFFSVKI